MLERKMETLMADKERELGDLKDQVRDLMFYLETQKKIAKTPEEERQVRLVCCHDHHVHCQSINVCKYFVGDHTYQTRHSSLTATYTNTFTGECNL